MPWPNFKLVNTGGTATERCPGDAIRSSLDVVWETRANEDDSDETDYRLRASMVFYNDVNTRSTTQADMDAYLAQQRIWRPQMRTAGPSGITTVNYPGFWHIERVAVTDNANGTSRVTTSCFTVGIWVDENGNAV